MRHLFRNYPIISIVLLLFACVRFEYNGPTWQIGFPGLAAGLAVLGIVGFVLLFRIFNAVQDACIAKGLIPARLRYKYDLLIPVAIVAASIRAAWRGESIQGMGGEQVPQWAITWSDPQLAAPFVAAIIGVVILIRILTLLRAITGQLEAGR